MCDENHGTACQCPLHPSASSIDCSWYWEAVLPVPSFVFLSWKKRNALIRGLWWRMAVLGDSMVKWWKRRAFVLAWCLRWKKFTESCAIWTPARGIRILKKEVLWGCLFKIKKDICEWGDKQCVLGTALGQQITSRQQLSCSAGLFFWLSNQNGWHFPCSFESKREHSVSSCSSASSCLSTSAPCSLHLFIWV